MLNTALRFLVAVASAAILANAASAQAGHPNPSPTSCRLPRAAGRTSWRAILAANSQQNSVNLSSSKIDRARTAISAPRPFRRQTVSVTRAGPHRPVVAVAEPPHSSSYGPAAHASPICGDSIQNVTESDEDRCRRFRPSEERRSQLMRVQTELPFIVI